MVMPNRKQNKIFGMSGNQSNHTITKKDKEEEDVGKGKMKQVKILAQSKQ